MISKNELARLKETCSLYVFRDGTRMYFRVEGKAFAIYYVQRYVRGELSRYVPLVEAAAKVSKCNIIRCEGLTPAHVRLYKALGFNPCGDDPECLERSIA